VHVAVRGVCSASSDVHCSHLSHSRSKTKHQQRAHAFCLLDTVFSAQRAGTGVDGIGRALVALLRQIRQAAGRADHCDALLVEQDVVQHCGTSWHSSSSEAPSSSNERTTAFCVGAPAAQEAGAGAPPKGRGGRAGCLRSSLTLPNTILCRVLVSRGVAGKELAVQALALADVGVTVAGGKATGGAARTGAAVAKAVKGCEGRLY